MSYFGNLSKEWAIKQLTQPQQKRNSDPFVTTAKVWNKETKKFKTITIKPGDNPMNKMTWRGDMLR